MKILQSGTIHFEHMKGVGSMDLDFLPNQRVYTLIGENGVGKTKFLESWLAVLLCTNLRILENGSWINGNLLPFGNVKIGSESFGRHQSYELSLNGSWFFSVYSHNYPIVYLSALNRANIQHENKHLSQIGDKRTREVLYVESLISLFRDDWAKEQLKFFGMDVNLEEWIIQRAQSSNPYQAKEDNREVEIKTLLTLLNKIDERIDSQFLEISGDYRVFIKVENQKRELSELSSGFSSILKILQSIIAGYSCFTNETQIANVRGVVLIDEIESHLHNQWQVKIIPLLKKLFPNTIFFITTHSSLVISQLEHGEAYRLERNKNDGVVYGKLIDYPSNVSFIDLLHDAFDVNLNELKRSRLNEETQEEAKKALLKLVQQELENMGDK